MMQKRRRVEVRPGERSKVTGAEIIDREIDVENNDLITTFRSYLYNGNPYTYQVREPIIDPKNVWSESFYNLYDMNAPTLFYELFDKRDPKNTYIHLYINRNKFDLPDIPALLQERNWDILRKNILIVSHGTFAPYERLAEQYIQTINVGPAIGVQCKFFPHGEIFEDLPDNERAGWNQPQFIIRKWDREHSMFYDEEAELAKKHLELNGGLEQQILWDFGRFLDPDSYPVDWNFKTYLHVPDLNEHISLPFIFNRNVHKPHMDMIRRDFLALLYAKIRK